MFSELADYCFVVVAAGNTNENIEKYSPTSAKNVIVVGAVNKSNKKATMSGYSDSMDMKWAPGTNIKINDEYYSGTSFSSAVYTACLANAILSNDLNKTDKYIQDYYESIKL